MGLMSDMKKGLSKESKLVVERFLSSPCCGEDKENGNYSFKKKQKEVV